VVDFALQSVLRVLNCSEAHGGMIPQGQASTMRVLIDATNFRSTPATSSTPNANLFRLTIDIASLILTGGAHVILVGQQEPADSEYESIIRSLWDEHALILFTVGQGSNAGLARGFVPTALRQRWFVFGQPQVPRKGDYVCYPGLLQHIARQPAPEKLHTLLLLSCLHMAGQRDVHSLRDFIAEYALSVELEYLNTLSDKAEFGVQYNHALGLLPILTNAVTPVYQYLRDSHEELTELLGRPLLGVRGLFCNSAAVEFDVKRSFRPYCFSTDSSCVLSPALAYSSIVPQSLSTQGVFCVLRSECDAIPSSSSASTTSLPVPSSSSSSTTMPVSPPLSSYRLVFFDVLSMGFENIESLPTVPGSFCILTLDEEKMVATEELLTLFDDVVSRNQSTMVSLKQIEMTQLFNIP
jgi:hypothetical protein